MKLHISIILLFLCATILISCAAGECSSGIPASTHKSSDMAHENGEKLYDTFRWKYYVLEPGINAVSDSEAGKVLYTLYAFEMEMDCGGLCSFFINSSSECAPYVSWALDKAGAFRLKEMYDSFISESGIDVNDLSEFKTDATDRYETLYSKYDFDSFDEAFYAIYEEENLHDAIIEYIRNNSQAIS